ncbi:MAG: carboxylyase [Methylobacter sp.]|nr:MAG: carboxylyase [Methylobacter sp.]PPD24278.1 MAG: carboxylyase [Methylobacter sp.]PPD35414.1 MAG: carboxylyase [Methylomonas sp.]
MTSTDISDLRTALEFLKTQDGELQTISQPVQAFCEISAIYAEKAGGVPVKPPTRQGPAMLFERVMPVDQPVVLGVFGSRERCAAYIGTTPDKIADCLIEASKNPLSPRYVDTAPVHQHVQTEAIDLSRLPIPTVTSDDAGPFVTLGLAMAKDPNGNGRNISVHRMCVQGPDTLTIWMVPGRHLESFYLAAKAQGKNLPIAIHIGLDPAIYMASCCPSPLIPLGFNELDIASRLRGRAYEIASCKTIDADCISHAEYVLEGEITHELIPESQDAKYSLPEFLGYNGKVHPGLPVVKIKAITHRNNPIYQTVIGPGYEQSNLLAFGLEAAILDFLRKHVCQRVSNAYCSPAGGGYLLLFLQFQKQNELDDGMVRQAALAVFGAFKMIKQIVLVDADVNVFSEEDVWWAMTTRFQVDVDLISVTNVLGFPLDPSQSPVFSPTISSQGLTAKAVFDCTVPYRLKAAFARVEFS